MKHVIALTALAFLMGAGETHAAELTEKTSCAEMAAAFDTRDFPKIRAFSNYVLNVMDNLDLKHARQGEPGIMAQLSDEGRSNMVPATSVNCRAHPKMTVYNSAAFVYTGIRELEIQLGTAK